jgi:hypothetical protein
MADKPGPESVSPAVAHPFSWQRNFVAQHEENTMKFILLSATALTLLAAPAQAAVPNLDETGLHAFAPESLLQLASSDDNDSDDDNSGSGSDNSGHGGGDDDRDDDRDDDSNDNDDNDDNGGRRGGASSDDSDDNNAVSGSGRSRARVPGGSGCDDAGDIAEHPECRNNN